MFENQAFLNIKLIDFGLSTILRQSNLNQHVGTPGFIAPEIFIKKHIDSKIDVYSTGIVLFNL